MALFPGCCAPSGSTNVGKAYIGVVDGHDLVAKDVLDNDRLDLGNGHAHGLLFARFSLLSVGLLG